MLILKKVESWENEQFIKVVGILWSVQCKKWWYLADKVTTINQNVSLMSYKNTSLFHLTRVFPQISNAMIN